MAVRQLAKFSSCADCHSVESYPEVTADPQSVIVAITDVSMDWYSLARCGVVLKTKRDPGFEDDRPLRPGNGRSDAWNRVARVVERHLYFLALARGVSFASSTSR
jgi:hypothetical protein